MKVQGKFKMQAHITRVSGVVMNVAAIKVSHSVRTDIDATTTLRAARARSKSIGAMGESSGNVQSANSYSILRTCKAALRQFSGAMDEMS